MTRVRCAIYTRKSSEEGLEQDFNSLDAQREACAAYVLSQASEGWQLSPEHYDDGGISGGTLERPALQRLLAHIAEGRVDIIVIYKVDRLTRSLLDFVKLVEAFDKAGVSFVSVTQSFNTTNSMGRLTLNMLLSFAQFEREVTAERIRDKLAASKACGMWMGGQPPIGYRNEGRTLVIVDEHAALVRDIFSRYLRLGNVRLVAEQLAAERITSPLRTLGTGRPTGGAKLSRGQIYQFLKNPIYLGLIRHRDKTYPGLHPAIIDQDVWDQTQARLVENTQGDQHIHAARPSLLAGLITDEAGEPLVATHACKGKVRYRYYVSRDRQQGAKSSNYGIRVPAREIETAVAQHLAAALDNPLTLVSQLCSIGDPETLRLARSRAAELADAVRGKDRASVRSLVASVQVLPSEVRIELAAGMPGEALGIAPTDEANITLTAPIRLTRTGSVVRLVQADGRSAAQRSPDAPMINLLARGRALWKRLEQGDIDITTLAREEGLNDSYVTRMVRLAFLAPSIVEDIVAGEQSAELSAATLLGAQLPACWTAQSELLTSARR